MNQPLSFQTDAVFLTLYVCAVVILAGVLIFAVNVKKIARKKNIY